MCQQENNAKIGLVGACEGVLFVWPAKIVDAKWRSGCEPQTSRDSLSLHEAVVTNKVLPQHHHVKVMKSDFRAVQAATKLGLFNPSPAKERGKESVWGYSKMRFIAH